MPAGYATKLVPLGRAWAAALGLSSEEQAAPQTTALPDLVNEGADYQGTHSKALLTRDSYGAARLWRRPGRSAGSCAELRPRRALVAGPQPG